MICTAFNTPLNAPAIRLFPATGNMIAITNLTACQSASICPSGSKPATPPAGSTKRTFHPSKRFAPTACSITPPTLRRPSHSTQTASSWPTTKIMFCAFTTGISPLPTRIIIPMSPRPSPWIRNSPKPTLKEQHGSTIASFGLPRTDATATGSTGKADTTFLPRPSPPMERPLLTVFMKTWLTT